MPDSKTSPRRLRSRAREVEALRLRMAGATYVDIATQMGVTANGAYQAVKRALKRLNEMINEEAAELRRLDSERLDRMHMALWSQASNVKGGASYGAVDRILRIMERRAKLWGLDAPTRQDIETKLAVYRVEYGPDRDSHTDPTAKAAPEATGDSG